MSKQFGRYQAESAPIGSGGMGYVYRAFDPLTNRTVAIKTLNPIYSQNSNVRERFRKEAETIAKLDHEAIVPIFDFHDDGQEPFIVMKFMSGGSLADRIKRGPIPVEEALRILERICLALDRAHSKKIIHRDLKPHNILFDEDNKAYLADFGVAHLIDGTQTRSLIGTLQYMAPEQSQRKDLSEQTDVYQMGIVFFEMITGCLPYSGDTPHRLVYRHMNDPLPSVCDVNATLPPTFDVILATATAKTSQSRFDSAGAFARAVSDVVFSQHKSPLLGSDFDSTFIARRLIDLVRLGLDKNFRPALTSILKDLKNRHLIADISAIIDGHLSGDIDLTEAQSEVGWRLQNRLMVTETTITIEKLYSLQTLVNTKAVSSLELKIGAELQYIQQWQPTPTVLLFGETGNQSIGAPLHAFAAHKLPNALQVTYRDSYQYPLITSSKFSSKTRDGLIEFRRKEWPQQAEASQDLLFFDSNSQLQGKISTRLEKLPLTVEGENLTIFIKPDIYKSVTSTKIFDESDQLLGHLIKCNKE